MSISTCIQQSYGISRFIGGVQHTSLKISLGRYSRGNTIKELLEAIGKMIIMIHSL